MQGLIYDLSIPKYLAAKAFNRFKSKKMSPIFPNLSLKNSLPIPTPRGENWVVIKSLMSGICGSDINMLKGDESFSMEPYASFPCGMGHENVGEIHELGPGVTEFQIGDRVIINPVMGCRVHERPLCEYCDQGLDALCSHFGDADTDLGPGMSLGYHRATGGGWSQYYQAHKTQVYKISADVPLERAVLADPLSSALQPIAEAAKNVEGPQEVFIYGAGTIGLLAIAAIRMLQLPWKVTLGYRYDFQAEKGKELGADKAIQTGGRLYQKVSEITGGTVRKVSLGKPVFEGGFDLIFDCVGSSQTIDDSLRMTKTKGKVCLIATGTSLDKVDPTPLWFREIQLVGTCMSRTLVDPRDGAEKQAYQLIAQELPNLNIESLTGHIYPISDYQKALTKAMQKSTDQVIKVAFKH